MLVIISYIDPQAQKSKDSVSVLIDKKSKDFLECAGKFKGFPVSSSYFPLEKEGVVVDETEYMKNLELGLLEEIEDGKLVINIIIPQSKKDSVVEFISALHPDTFIFHCPDDDIVMYRAEMDVMKEEGITPIDPLLN